MRTTDGTEASPAGADVNRREFLRTSGLAAAGLALPAPGLARRVAGTDDRAVILLMLVGGPSQLETWDPKPGAPAEVRGPFRPIATAVPGVQVCEHLPRTAARLDRLTLVRSLHHDAAPIHETGHQLVQTGRLSRADDEAPHAGSVVSRLLGPRNGTPASVMLPGPIGNTGVGVAHGQTAGALGSAYEPVVPTATGPFAGLYDVRGETGRTREAYGPTEFGRNCLRARRFVEAGARFVTVNMFRSVFDGPTWDCHGHAPFSTLEDCAASVLPVFDRAFNALLDDLERLGRLGSTLVVATGEFGRTPQINRSGGRDHWPQVWSAALAGGGARGGQVIGASDDHAAYPSTRPVTPAELAATMYRALGLAPEHASSLGSSPGSHETPPAAPIAEVFG